MTAKTNQMNKRILANALGDTEYELYLRGESAKDETEIREIYDSYLAKIKETVESEVAEAGESSLSDRLSVRVSFNMRLHMEIQARAQKITIADMLREAIDFYMQQFEIDPQSPTIKQDVLDLQKNLQNELQNEYQQLVQEMREMFAFLAYSQTLMIVTTGATAAEHQILMGLKGDALDAPSDILKRAMDLNSQQFHGLFDRVQYLANQMWLPYVDDNSFRQPLRLSDIKSAKSIGSVLPISFYCEAPNDLINFLQEMRPP